MAKRAGTSKNRVPALQPLLGQNLRRMLDPSIDVATLARAVGVTRRHMGRILAGQGRGLRRDTIAGLVATLGISAAELHPALAGVRRPLSSPVFSQAELMKLSQVVCSACRHAAFPALSHYAGIGAALRVPAGTNPSTPMDVSATEAMLEVLLRGIMELNAARREPHRFALYGEELDGDIPLDPALDRLLRRHPEVDVCRSAAAFSRALDQGHSGLLFDALDGTINALNRLPFFATAVAVIERGSPTIGAVFDPVRNELFYAIRGSRGSGEGFRWNLGAGSATPLPRSQAGPQLPIVAVHFSRDQAGARSQFSKFVGQLGNRFTIAALNSGQLALALVGTAIAAYLNPRTSVWDCAAGEALIRASASARISTFNRRPIDYMSSHAQTSIIAAATPELYEELLRSLRAAGMR